MVMQLRRLDAFQKTRPDVQSKSAVGGIITLVAGSTAAVLFVAQLFRYVTGSTQHSLSLSQSTSIPLLPLGGDQHALPDKGGGGGRIPLKVHVTFPHVSCDQLDIIHDGASMSTGEFVKVHGRHTLQLRTPTHSELSKIGMKKGRQGRVDGCTVTGTMQPYIVAGSLAICLSRAAWAEAAGFLSMAGHVVPRSGGGRDAQMERTLQQYNVSHYIHNIEFGQTFSKAADKPLQDVAHIIQNQFYGIAVAQTQVKLIPVSHQRLFGQERSYQQSVVDITIQPHTLVSHGVQQLPGLVVTYDFTPLMVHHTEGRENILVFLSSLVSIVGGVYVTVKLLTGCLVHSAQAVTKKID
jgi:hypothetical protein